MDDVPSCDGDIDHMEEVFTDRYMDQIRKNMDKMNRVQDIKEDPFMKEIQPEKILGAKFLPWDIFPCCFPKTIFANFHFLKHPFAQFL